MLPGNGWLKQACWTSHGPDGQNEPQLFPFFQVGENPPWYDGFAPFPNFSKDVGFFPVFGSHLPTKQNT